MHEEEEEEETAGVEGSVAFHGDCTVRIALAIVVSNKLLTKSVQVVKKMRDCCV